MTDSNGARRRFDAMIERAVHASTPLPEALTALEGARRVAAKNPGIPASSNRIASAEAVLGLRSFGNSTSTVADSLNRIADAARGAFTVVRQRDGVYARRYTAGQANQSQTTDSTD